MGDPGTKFCQIEVCGQICVSWGPKKIKPLLQGAGEKLKYPIKFTLNNGSMHLNTWHKRHFRGTGSNSIQNNSKQFIFLLVVSS